MVAAEIAKIHTIEWTPQLLYDEPLYIGMNANWNGLLGERSAELSKALRQIVYQNFGKSTDVEKAHAVVFGVRVRPGHFRPRQQAATRLRHHQAEVINGGVNHFGSPFNFPEEFVYRLPPAPAGAGSDRVPRAGQGSEQDRSKIPVVETFQGKATDAMRSRGPANWALSMGRQRLGSLTLHNSPQFMQNIKIPRLESDTQQIDIAALDLIRDREHGVPRFNEFRRQYGLRQLTSFDDFIDPHLPPIPRRARAGADRSQTLREVYGQHVCDAIKVITDAQRNDDGTPINDCLGIPNGTLGGQHRRCGYRGRLARGIHAPARLRDIGDAVRGVHSERLAPAVQRPLLHVQFPAGVLHQLGVDWVNNNGPARQMMEQGTPNGHKQPVSPLKRVLLRTIPELAAELEHVVNAFDPWARDRGEYYTLDWKPRPGAESDDAFEPSAASRDRPTSRPPAGIRSRPSRRSSAHR